MNNALITKKTMSSLDLRDLINSARAEFSEPTVENSHFLKRIENELEGETGKRKVFVNPEGGRPSGYYELTIDQCLLVGMRESKSVRRKVLLELNNREAPPPVLPDFTNPVESARAWADAMEEKQKYELAYEEAKPAVEFVDKYVDKSNLITFRQACKIMNAKENVVRDYLVDKKIMYRLNGNLTAHNQHINAGRFAVKTGVNSNNGAAYVATMFTPKGVKWLAGELAKSQVQLDI